MAPKIILLSGKGQYGNFFYNGLKDSYPVEKVIEEEADLERLFKKRRKKIGTLKVWGQLLFHKYIVKKLMQQSKGRVKEIILQHGLNPSKIPDDKKVSVSSLNDAAAIALVNEINPDIIVVNNTGMLSKRFLHSVKAKIINIHGGINPAYRGMAGAYWALVNNDQQRCGSTIHLVDEGVDTGAVLYQDTIEVSAQDNYLTYPFLQMAKEIQMVKKAIKDIDNNDVKPVIVGGASKLWYEPTIWAYWYNRAVKRVK